MNSDMNIAQQDIVATRKKFNDMESMAIGNIRRAKVNLLMGKGILAMETFGLIWGIIITYASMFYFFANQSFPLTLGFWYLGIDVGIFWIPAWLGYVIWKTLARQSTNRKAKLLEALQKAEESYAKVIELRKNAETLMQKLEVMK